MGGTLSWGNIYGPSGGQSVAQSASIPSITTAPLDRLPLAPLALIALGVLAWWALEKWD